MPGWADDLAPLDLEVRPTCVVMNSICGKFLRPPAQLLKPSKVVGYHIPIMSRSIVLTVLLCSRTNATYITEYYIHFDRLPTFRGQSQFSFRSRPRTRYDLRQIKII
jgi:hypothetical protein